LELTAVDNKINGAANWPAPYFFETVMAIEDSTAGRLRYPPQEILSVMFTVSSVYVGLTQPQPVGLGVLRVVLLAIINRWQSPATGFPDQDFAKS
jgi:hypothetical protein